MKSIVKTLLVTAVTAVMATSANAGRYGAEIRPCWQAWFVV
jgi:hypothetical protein